MPPGMRLAEAIDGYRTMRAQIGTRKGERRREATLLGRFLAINGDIWVHQIALLQVERAMGSDPSPADLTTLDTFLAWCKRNRWMGRLSDPLEPYRAGLPQTPDPFAGVKVGGCTICGRNGQILTLSISRDGSDPISLEACKRCRVRSPRDLMRAGTPPSAKT
jgi:hypothetical protein